ncbi:ATP-binding protein [Candidatus Colwellia aromaticivorans]|uniref:ATP-binding protein n=1 Tax=Candidatus Colwellia aromaticivorans TaxID=2267621 RepID=UPI000DF264E7|nr:ATP-binding protein [Candidatus Colwellia aromaticivorans]
MPIKPSTKIKVLFSSFSIKLFTWFWLIAITSIFSTRFISHQLSNEAYNTVISQAPLHDELRKLHNTARKIERSKIKNIDKLLQTKLQQFIKAPFNLWFKSLDNNPTVSSMFLLPPKHQQALTRYLNEQIFDQAITSNFSHTRLVGPVLIKINKQKYQLFISRKQHKRNFGRLVQELPSWARVAIPVLISFILCLLLARSFSKPIATIKKATTELGKGHLATRVKGVTKRNDELGQLANSFNQMAEQLEQNQSAQQRLLGDVSHELRSPMTRLQMALGLAQQESTTKLAREQYLQRCQLEVERLNQMIEDALVLSRLENTLQIIKKTHLDFTALVQKIIYEEQFIANEKSITIVLDSTVTVELLGDHNLLFSAINNVVTNAVKYSPEHSTIKVSLSVNDQFVSLVVSDNGIGVPPESLTELFTPFYRVNLARDRKTGGTGLGLAIAKQAINAHQGNIFAKNNEIKGLSVTIQLPL